MSNIQFLALVDDFNDYDFTDDRTIYMSDEFNEESDNDFFSIPCEVN